MTFQEFSRREFIKISAAATAGVASRSAGAPWAPGYSKRPVVVDDFSRPDGFYHGDGWESMNPGYWMIRNNALRRRLTHRGDERPVSSFPWHWENRQKPMPTEYDPSLPFGMIFRRDWKLTGNYAVTIEATVRELPPRAERYTWKHFKPGYALMGIAFGSKCLHESWEGASRVDQAAAMAVWKDDGTFGIFSHTAEGEPLDPQGVDTSAPVMRSGDRIKVHLVVEGDEAQRATIRATLKSDSAESTVILEDVDRISVTDGYFGLVARGLLDFEVKRVILEPEKNEPLDAPVNELHVCYALGDTLQRVDGHWRCRFIAAFRNGGEKAEIRMAQTPEPAAGWASAPVAGSARIVTNDFRRNTAVIDAILPENPTEATLYYTVWKDGRDVTHDPRPGTDSVGPGTGYLDASQIDGRYVGRLPRLSAPYRLIGLSCHAIAGNRPNLPEAAAYQAWWLHDQPTPGVFGHLEEFGSQTMVWEDDVWYLELIFPPPSTDDAYKVIMTTLGGPTTRWQMMRHWNVLNPGDHDYGMDDVKGPEQIIIRNVAGLGQDPEYMRRNFQIVRHLVSGNDAPSGTDNPKHWRRWKMPAGDFSLLILDGRLWRSSQDTNIWDDEGWGHKKSLYSRSDPTRTLLGEEQFAWLSQMIRTDSSPLIALTGINGLHAVWTGHLADPDTKEMFAERDRVAADYAGWVRAGVARVLNVLGSRQGVVSVYGDVHNGCIMKNKRQRVYECSFGPIGRTGGRDVKPDFGPNMTDFNGEELEAIGLYHQKYGSPELAPLTGPEYWNFLEMVFDPRGADPEIILKIRNVIDRPSDTPRGGGYVRAAASSTGRLPSSELPPLHLLPDADAVILLDDHTPVRGGRTLPDGTLRNPQLIGVEPGARVLIAVRAGNRSESFVTTTRAIAS